MDTEKQALLLSPYLTVYLDRHDKALGFSQLGLRTREAVSYHYVKQTEIEQELLRSASKVLKLKGIQAKVGAIIKEAELATPERRKELLAEAKRLRRQARDG